MEAGAPAGREAKRRPRRRKPAGPARCESYRIRVLDVLLVLVIAAAAASLLWGYGCAYQEGYGRGYERGQEVALHA